MALVTIPYGKVAHVTDKVLAFLESRRELLGEGSIDRLSGNPRLAQETRAAGGAR